jgi:hypothetical protein
LELFKSNILSIYIQYFFRKSGGYRYGCRASLNTRFDTLPTPLTIDVSAYGNNSIEQ